MREEVRKKVNEPYNLDLCRDFSFMTQEELDEYEEELKTLIAEERAKKKLN